MPIYGQGIVRQAAMRKQQPSVMPGIPEAPNVGPGGIPVPTKGLPGAFRGPGEASSAYLRDFLLPQESYRAERQGAANERYDAALADPTGTADQFGKYFQEAAAGFAAPAMRDFTNNVSRVQANTASRFGGNASTAESKDVYNTSDLFSRNLSEAIARLAPQAAGMGLQYTGMLGSAANQATGDRDNLSSLELQGIGMFPQPKKKASALGGLVGAAASFLPGAKEALDFSGFTGG